ncbi:hypothetical protein ACFSRY_18950 [Pontibacter locisalis]|uniref:Uncharacterized protein n=1 Tax=Pontibacter locisalis TaxID=1719035 RepID=A0ABW5ISM9_9BACT
MEFLDGGRLEVTAHKLKDGVREKVIFRRIFYPEKTKQISIYGLDGEDRFLFTGKGKSRIKIDVFGGAGEDLYAFKSIRGKKNKVHIHDSTYGNEYPAEDMVKVKKDDNPPAQTLDSNGKLLKYYLD